MSKYMVNKLMRHVEMSDRNVLAYVADPAGLLAEWLAGGAGPDQSSDDRTLTEPEHAAFAARDYAALYALGANPYLLWHFTEAVFIHETTWPALNERYRDAVAPHGYPDAVV